MIVLLGAPGLKKADDTQRRNVLVGFDSDYILHLIIGSLEEQANGNVQNVMMSIMLNMYTCMIVPMPVLIVRGVNQQHNLIHRCCKYTCTQLQQPVACANQPAANRLLWLCSINYKHNVTFFRQMTENARIGQLGWIAGDTCMH